MTRAVKMWVVGDGGVGKSSLIIRHATGGFPVGPIPTVFDSFCGQHVVEGKAVDASYWDRYGGEDYDRMRKLSYPLTDVFLVCFAITSRKSLQNVAAEWLPELSEHCPGVPLVLCGTKTDLRDDADTLEQLADRGESVVSEEEGRQLAQSIGAKAYVECSALTGDGVKHAFDLAVAEGVAAGAEDSSARRSCVLL